MNTQARFKAVIVDDEPLAREKIREMLKDDAAIEIVAECASGPKAVAAIEKFHPDLLFLDIQMPQMDGFAVLGAISQENMPHVIFVTAYDQYALKAFEVYALDYLLKPFDRERFRSAVNRAKSQVRKDQTSQVSEGILALLAELQASSRQLDRLVIKNAGRIHFLKTNEIDWIEAEGNYVRIHSGKESHLLREPISSLETQLNGKSS